MDGGPFLWVTHADAVVDRADWASACRPGRGTTRPTRASTPALRHDRRVVLDPGERRLTVVDVVTGTTRHSVRLSWHLGPGGHRSPHRARGRAALAGPTAAHGGPSSCCRASSTWSAHRGETDPPLGWYSPRFGVRVPTTTLVGAARGTGTLTLTTDLRLPSSTDAPADDTGRPVAVGHADPRDGSRRNVRHISTTMAPPPNAGRQRGSWIRLRGRGRGPTLESFRPHRRNGS